MIINRRHIHALDVIAVLMFSVFASYLVSEDAVKGHIFIFEVILRSVFLLIAATIFYFTVDNLKRIEQEAIREYESEKDTSKKAANSISQRYEGYYRSQQGRINFKFILSILLFACFFLFAPVAELLEGYSTYKDQAAVFPDDIEQRNFHDLSADQAQPQKEDQAVKID